jgi:RNA polymerase sigma factor (sigma-70 family)
MPAPVPDPAVPMDDLRAAQRGDADAFERLYRAHVGRVHLLALRLTGDTARAESLTQDAFVRAWRKLATFRGESSLATWLHRLTVNVFLLDERGDRRRSGRELTDAPLDALDGPRRHEALDLDDRMDLERAIARLPEGARLAFVLHDIQGYTHDEIAALSGVASSTVRVQLHRARRRLMEELDR